MGLLHMDMQHILIQKSWWSVIIKKKKNKPKILGWKQK